MKNVIIILLIVVIITLFFFIFTGKFCHCSDLICPNTQEKDYII